MKKTFAALVVGSAALGLVVEVACNNGSSSSGNVPSVARAVATATAAERRDDDRRTSTSAESSPYIVGVWKFIPAADGGTPSVDTEFRFINPGDNDVTLEYAFFESDTGAFCGCDRDTFLHNKTTIYTVLGEQQTPAPANPSVNQFFCTGTSGALKAIVFKHKGQKIFLDDATQVGFQTHAFGSLVETPFPNDAGNFNFLQGAVMTEAGMKGIAINAETRAEIEDIHEQCVTLQGPL